MVLVNNRIQGLDIPCVVSDEYGGVRQALEHLIGRGHRNIAMLAGRFSPYILGERYRAFLEVTQAHGLPADTPGTSSCAIPRWRVPQRPAWSCCPGRTGPRPSSAETT